MDQRFRIFSDYTCRWISIIVFMLVITVPMLGHIGGYFDQSYISTTEKRTPNLCPDNSLIKTDFKKYISALESYLNDHFGFREKLVRLNSLLRLEIGMSSSEKVTIGKDGWLFYSAENIIDQYRGIWSLSSDEISSWVEAADSRTKWLSERGIKCIFVFFPEKTSAYPEYLPDWATKVSPTIQDHIKRRLDNSDIDYIDVTPFILEAKKNNPVYYKTDSHWNFHGGFVGYSALMKRVNQYFPETKALIPDDIEFGYKKSKSQDLTQILNLTGTLKDPNADFYVLKKPSRVISVEQLNKNDRLPCIVKTDIKNAPRVLIIRDSYTDLLEPFLNETFSEILYMSHGDLTFDPDLVSRFKPDLVMNLMVERILKYPMYGPISPDLPYIIDWGPKEIFEREIFYLQNDGRSAVWVKAKNINKFSTIIWDGYELNTTADIAAGIITAPVPDSLHNKLGSHKLIVKNMENGKVSREFSIIVKALIR